MSVHHPRAPTAALINRGGDGRSHSQQTGCSISQRGTGTFDGAVGEEDRNLLLAATGQRGGEGKLMAAWLDKGEDEG